MKYVMRLKSEVPHQPFTLSFWSIKALLPEVPDIFLQLLGFNSVQSSTVGASLSSISVIVQSCMDIWHSRSHLLKINAGELLKLFQDCKLVMRWDVQTCLFLMPYIIHNTLNGRHEAAAGQQVFLACSIYVWNMEIIGNQDPFRDTFNDWMLHLCKSF